MKLLIFGTGEYYRRKKELVQRHEIIAFLDNDISKQGKRIDGIIVLPPSAALQLSFDFVCILSMYYCIMEEQLIDLGIPEKKILGFFQVGMLNEVGDHCFYIQHMGKNSIREKNVVLFSHNLYYGGAPIALLRLAKILVELQYNICLISPFDGPLRADFENDGIKVFIESYIDCGNFDFFEWLRQFDLIIINTVFFHRIINQLLKLNIPILWWIHESLGNRVCDFSSYRINEKDYLHVYGVGYLAIKMYTEKFKNNLIEELLYYVPDRQQSTFFGHNDKVVFAIIGGIQFDKGQDVFVDAIKLLSRDELMQCEFWIIGKVIDKKVFDYIYEQTKTLLQVKILGEIEYSKLQNIYQDIQVIVQPSRNDTMPTVVVEGMMYEKVCIVSDATGISDLIIHKENGLICKVNDPANLMIQFRWIIENRNSLNLIGKFARNVYEKNFTEKKFKKEIIQILEKIEGGII